MASETIQHAPVSKLLGHRMLGSTAGGG